MSSRTIPASLAHFLIFNPTIQPPPKVEQERQNVDTQRPTGDEDGDGRPAEEEEERDRDLEDDLKEAAQILFYTSRSSRTVSRDTMLKQTSLIKGAMGFTDMLTTPAACADPARKELGKIGEEGYISIKMGKSRMIGLEVERNSWVVVNVTLAMGVDEEGKKDSSGSQGLSDLSIVKALHRGYEDFRLLYGTLESLLPPSPNLSSTLERFWTKFAFTFEDQIISPSTSLTASLPTHLTPDNHTAQGVQRALELYMEDVDLSPGTDYGVITQHGPMYSSIHDAALHRFLTSLVVGSLPPTLEVKQDTRHTLGIGKSTTRVRNTSWGLGGLGMGWVPTLPGITPRSVTPVSSNSQKERSVSTPGISGENKSDKAGNEGKEVKSRWGFGMGMPALGLGEAMETVGGVFGLSGSGTAGQAEKNGPVRAVSIHTAAMESHAEGLAGQVEQLQTDDTASMVTQMDVDVEELEAAVQQTPEIDLGWEKRSVYIGAGHEAGPSKRRLTWTMRDSILLFILYPETTEPPYPVPPTRPTLALYSKINAILSPETSSRNSTSSESPRHGHPDSALVQHRESRESIGPALDLASSASLLEIQDLMKSDPKINEMYARTSAGRFVISKTLSSGTGRPDEPLSVHMLVGRKDANLPDAEHALRALLRSRQEISA